MFREDEKTFQIINRFVRNRSHQNIMSWAMYITLAGHGSYHAQKTLAEAVKENYPRILSKEEYETSYIYSDAFPSPTG